MVLITAELTPDFFSARISSGFKSNGFPLLFTFATITSSETSDFERRTTSSTVKLPLAGVAEFCALRVEMPKRIRATGQKRIA